MNITSEQLHAFRTAAEKAWSDDTRHEAYRGHPQPSAGQCYVTSRWLTHHLGGNVARKGGHYFWLSPDEQHAIDLTGDRFAYRPESPRLEGLKLDAEDTGTELQPHHKTYRAGPILHKRADHPLFEDHEVVPSQESNDAFNRATIFMQRANRALANPQAKLATDYAGDALPAEEPQAEENIDQRYWHDEPNHTPGSGEYYFIYAGGQLHIDPSFNHSELAGHAQIDPANHQGPFAAGYVHLNMGKAIWEVHGNISPNALLRVFKDACKHYGWQWGGMTDISGEPVGQGSEFAPKKSSRPHFYVYDEDKDHLYISLSVASILDKGDLAGYMFREGDTVRLSKVFTPPDSALEALKDWAADEGLEFTSANDNVVKRIEDMQQHNNYSPQGDYDFSTPQQHDERQPGGVFRCPDCLNIYPSWDLYLLHRKDHPQEEPLQDGHFPEVGNDDQPLKPRFMEQETPMVNTGSLKEALRVDGYYFEHYDHSPDTYYVAYRYGCPIGVLSMYGDHLNELTVAPGQGEVVRDVLLRHAMFRHQELISHLHYPGFTYAGSQMFRWAKGKQPKDLVDAPIPFIYDVKDDKIFVGHPGTRHSDIVGQFTPGGIVEGTYEPGGKVIIHSATNMPYTTRHMLELFYFSQPQLEIKSVHLRDETGKDIRLAGTHRAGPPTEPPAYRKATEKDKGHCGGCKMFTEDGKCWGYGMKKVESDYVCDSFAPETREQYNKMSSADIGGYIAALVASDPAAYGASRALRQAGGEVYVVGGAVRDALVGIEPHDIDLMVTGLPADAVRTVLERLPGSVNLVGKDFGVFRYKQPGQQGDIQVALPRREHSTGTGHKDFSVQGDHTMKPEEDLYRRDFTPNAMAVDLGNGRLVDPFGGAQDIQTGAFRTLSGRSLADDPLRTMRALVLNGRYGLLPDKDTREQMREHASALSHLPQERIQAELDKILESDDPASAIKLAHETGVLKYFLPEVDAEMGYDQKNPHHAHDLGTHSLNVLRETAKQTADPDVRLAALLHDIGKPASAWWHPEQERQKYYQYKAERDLRDAQGNVVIPAGTMVGQHHDQVGGEMARARLDALRFPTDRIDRVSSLIDHHMFPAFSSARGARKFLQKVGPHADDLMTLRDADMGGKGTDQSAKTPVEIQRELLDRVRNQGEATSLPQLQVNGNDLMQLGIPEGPLVGQTLRQLLAAVVHDPELNNRDTLLELARSYAGV